MGGQDRQAPQHPGQGQPPHPQGGDGPQGFPRGLRDVKWTRMIRCEICRLWVATPFRSIVPRYSVRAQPQPLLVLLRRRLVIRVICWIPLGLLAVYHRGELP